MRTLRSRPANGVASLHSDGRVQRFLCRANVDGLLLSDKAAEDDPLLALADKVVAASQCTLLESHLCRAYKKDKSEHAATCTKYVNNYATVPGDDVHTLLWTWAQSFMKTD